MLQENVDPPFVLGTVQLGTDYGATNRDGQPSIEQAFSILDRAYAVGVRCFDTAHAYGTSEGVIGSWASGRDVDTAIITKIPPSQNRDVAHSQQAFAHSLEDLKRETVEGCLLHRAEDLEINGMRAWVDKLLSGEVIGGFGVSVYDADEIPDDPVVTLLQIPANIFVQDTIRSDSVRKITEQGGRVFVRSVLAQGVLLEDPKTLCRTMPVLCPFVVGLQELCDNAGVTPAALCIAAVRYMLPSVEVVVGCDGAEQVDQLALAAQTTCTPDVIEAALELGRTAPSGLFDPRTWQSRQ